MNMVGDEYLLFLHHLPEKIVRRLMKRSGQDQALNKLMFITHTNKLKVLMMALDSTTFLVTTRFTISVLVATVCLPAADTLQ